jgi:hypothetical protein
MERKFESVSVGDKVIVTAYGNYISLRTVSNVIHITPHFFDVDYHGTQTRFRKDNGDEKGGGTSDSWSYSATPYTKELADEVESENRQRRAISKTKGFLIRRFTPDELLKLHDILTEANAWGLGKDNDQD